MKKQSNSRSWTRAKLIGRGSFGHVSLAVNDSDGRVFAVKSVELGTSHPAQVEALENEIGILRSFSGDSSQYVVGFLGDDVSHEPHNKTYRNLHLEYLSGGTVTDVSVSRRATDVDERILRWQVRCLISSLKFLHEHGIVHCDVKGKNVLVGSDYGTVKLADFGSAIEPGKMSDTGPIVPRGSPLWMAPEVIRRESQGPASDVWSLGCTVVEMVTCKPAWEDCGFETLRRIGFSDELPKFPTRLSELGRDFLERCLRRDPNQRWSCDQLLDHPFVATASPPSEVAEVSPRCVLDFDDAKFDNSGSSGRGRIGRLAAEGEPDWELDGWEVIRGVPGTDSVDSPVSGSERVDDDDDDEEEWQLCNFEEVKRIDVSNKQWNNNSWGKLQVAVEKKKHENNNWCKLVAVVFHSVSILRHFLLDMVIIMFYYYIRELSRITFYFSSSISALSKWPIKFSLYFLVGFFSFDKKKWVDK